MEKLAVRLKWAEQSGESFTLGGSWSAQSVETYLQSWLRDHAKVNCKASTCEEYERAIDDVLIPAFGKRTLNGLTQEDIRRFIADCVEQNKAKSTIRNYLSPLRAAYTQAIEDGLVGRNPVAKLGKLCKAAKDSAGQMQALTRREVAALLATAGEQLPWLHPILLCAVRTGLRRGELIGLQWGDVDFHGRFLLVRRTVTRNRVGTPKNGKIRRVEVSRQLYDALQALNERQEVEAIGRGEGLEPHAWVFRSPMGCRLEERNLDRAWAYCLKESGIRQVRFHDLRHTYASLLIAEGAHPKYIQEQLGYSSIQVTMDVYGHLFPNRNRGLVDRLDMAEVEGVSATPAQPTTGKVHKLARPEGVEPPTLRSVV